MSRRVMVAALCVGGGIAALAVSPFVSAPSPSGPPSVAGLLLGWWPDVVFGVAAVVLAVLYLLGVRRVPGWPRGRTAMWLTGCAVVLVATSSGIGRYAPVMISMLLASQVLLAVVAPVLLVLGGPVSLALRALPRSGRDDVPGPREWLVALLRSRVCRVLTQPAVAFGLLLGPFYLFYVFGSVDVVLGSHWSHLGINAVALLAGYAFFWSVIGVDPGVRRLPHAGRIGQMAALLLGIGYLAVVVGSANTVLGEGFLAALGLVDVAADQRNAGNLIWALGEMPVLVVLMATVAQWARADERAAVRADTEPDLAAYNDMLAELADPPRH
ncbi:cytochrome c oxidase assembly protein [Actinophytocola glycyrrhizae]|uniref:Cytochrome c oxidase assembly protein n=1 Tax=Actinophytocola glycyrrhizae TaxID=2044873 RepID=A0ABV9RXC4_9PSEU